MKDVKATRSAKFTEDAIEQAAERTASEFAERESRAKDAAAKASGQAMRASVEMIQRNAETVQHTLQCSAKLAARMTEHSADQFGRAIGFSGDGAQKAAQKSSRNIEAIVQSGTVLTEITQRLSEEWADIARARMDRGFDRIDALLQCRTPQDFAALQRELLRDKLF
jgi:Phasin protein